MANILQVTCGFESLLYPSVELARRLAAAGHQVTFASLPGARELVEYQGLGFLPLKPSRYEEFLEADAKAGPFHRLLNLRRRRARAKEEMALESFAQALRDMDLDLVLVDGEMHEHILCALGSGVPTVLLNSFASIWRLPGLPPAHHLVQPGVGWKGTPAGMALLWFALRLRKWWRAASLRVRRVGCDRLSMLRLLAHEAGLDFGRTTDDSQWLIPFTYRQVPVLSLHALEFEFPHQPKDGVHYVGPMVLEGRMDRPLPAADRTRLEALLARRASSWRAGARRAGAQGEQLQGPKRLIYAGFGSVLSTDRAFLKRLVGVVAERPDWELVISLSGRLAAADLGTLPERVHVFSWVPQTLVLQSSDVVVTHGGINTIDECVLEGVPMLVCCGFQTDMAGNTARVVYHGLGLAGDRRQDTTRVIRQHLDRLLDEPQFAANLRRLKQRYEAYAENRVAEQVVASLLDEGSDVASN